MCAVLNHATKAPWPPASPPSKSPQQFPQLRPATHHWKLRKVWPTLSRLRYMSQQPAAHKGVGTLATCMKPCSSLRHVLLPPWEPLAAAHVGYDPSHAMAAARIMPANVTRSMAQSSGRPMGPWNHSSVGRDLKCCHDCLHAPVQHGPCASMEVCTCKKGSCQVLT